MKKILKVVGVALCLVAFTQNSNAQFNVGLDLSLPMGDFGKSSGIGFGGSLGGQKKTPAGKAIRAALIEATDYLACVMYDQDSCVQEYRDKERSRRDSSKSALKLD